MAQTIKYIGPYGSEVGSMGTTLNVLAEPYDGATLLARRVVQGFRTKAERDERAQAVFAGIDAAETAPSVPSTTGWPTSVAKAAKAMEIG